VREAAAATPLGVVLAGHILTATGGYPTRSWGGRGESREIDGPDDARAAVAEQLDEGATVIKVALEPAGGPLPDVDVLAAIVAAAHDADVRVTAHVGDADALAMAIAAGIDELAHLPLYDVTPEDMVRAAGAGMVLCATLAIRGGGDVGAGRAVAAFREAGGTVLYGTDLGNGGTSPGIMATEVRALLDTGMRPVEVLDAATATAADHLGLPDRGRIAVDAVADLVAVAGDPLADPSAYEDVRLVLASGIPVRDDLT
jgi:imidazolonepropionase-like amidohydrolase